MGGREREGGKAESGGLCREEPGVVYWLLGSQNWFSNAIKLYLLYLKNTGYLSNQICLSNPTSYLHVSQRSPEIHIGMNSVLNLPSDLEGLCGRELGVFVCVEPLG